MNRMLELNRILNEVKSAMIPLAGKNEAAVKKNAIALSKKKKGMYIVVFVDFGEAFASMAKNLNVFAPSDSTFDWYAHNGTAKKFSDKKKTADQNATPILN